jgi:hypothetical protein
MRERANETGQRREVLGLAERERQVGLAVHRRLQLERRPDREEDAGRVERAEDAHAEQPPERLGADDEPAHHRLLRGTDVAGRQLHRVARLDLPQFVDESVAHETPWRAYLNRRAGQMYRCEGSPREPDFLAPTARIAVRTAE